MSKTAYAIGAGFIVHSSGLRLDRTMAAPAPASTRSPRR